MPIKTQMRLTQITGSIGTGAGQINDAQSKEAKASINSADLSSVLSHLAAGIKRIHGDGDFSDSHPGQFQHSRMSVTGSELALLNTYEIATEGANTTLSLGGKSGVNLKEDGTTIFAIDDNRNVTVGNAGSVDIQASATVSIDSSGGPIAIGSDNDNEDIVVGTNGTRTITIGRAASASTTLNLRGSAANVHLDAGTNKFVLTGSGFDTTPQAFNFEVKDGEGSAWSIDASGGQADLIKVDTSLDRVHIHELVVDTDSTLDNLTVNGNLTVLGSQTTLDVETLTVEDKFILLGDGNQQLNDASGIIFASGSNQNTRPDAAFGKLHSDTNGVFVFGSVASNSASITDLSGLTADLPLRSGVFQVGNAGTEEIDVNGAQLRLKSAAGHEFDLGGANHVIDFGHGGTQKGQIAFNSNKLRLSSSLDSLQLQSAFNGVELLDEHDGVNARRILTARYNAQSLGSEILFDSSRPGAVNTANNQPLQLGHFGGGFLEIGTLDGGAKMGRAPLQISGSYNAAGSGEYQTTLVVGGAEGEFGSDVLAASKATLIVSGSALRLDHGVSGSAGLQFKSDTDKVVALKAPLSLANSVSLTLPPDDGSNGDVLITDGNGVLTFAPAGGAANSRKYTGTVDTGLAANTALSFDATSGVSDVTVETFDLDLRNVAAVDRLNNVDVYVNGQLMMSGTSAPQADVTGGDYVLIDVNTGTPGFQASEDKADLKFAFALEVDDVVSVIMRA